MKKYILLLTIPLIVGCHIGQQKYSYIEIVNSPTEGIIEKAPEVFYEKNDSLAYEWAMDRFSVSKGIFQSMDGKSVQQAAKVPLTFVVIDKTERKIFRGDDDVAYKNARFGMSRDKVKALNLSRSEDLDFSIDDDHFSVNLNYSDADHLYWVQFMSEMYEWTQYYDVVQPLAEKLLASFQKEYGIPTFVNEMPSRNIVHRSERIVPLYIWDMQKKYVVIGLGSDEKDNLPIFYIDARIIEKQTWYSLFNNDIEAAEDAYWSKMGTYAALYYKLQIDL